MFRDRTNKSMGYAKLCQAGRVFLRQQVANWSTPQASNRRVTISTTATELLPFEMLAECKERKLVELCVFGTLLLSLPCWSR